MVKQTTNKKQIDEITGRNNAEWLKNIYKDIVCKDYQNYVFITLNIKDFRYFTVYYGYEQGNRILKLVMDCICRHLNDKSYAARGYADGFDILYYSKSCKDVEDEFLYPFIDDIFDVTDPIIYHNIYTSFGLYKLENSDEDYFTAQNKAEIARLGCREFNHRSFCFDEMNEQRYESYLARNTLNSNLTSARLNNEFVPFIQPKIDLKTDQVVGGEILMRWINKDGELIPLSNFFFSLVEKADIYLIDLNLFDQVCGWLDQRIKENKPVVPLSFNITNTSFFDINFLDDYIEIFHKYNIPEAYIEFEFLEDIQFGLNDQVIDTIDKLKAFGFICSLDDFGSGYSSFNVLLKSKVDIIKLDRMFFQKKLTEEYERMLRHTILALKEMNVKILAEGVETKEYVDFLKSAGCDFVQGFYYHKPMPLAEFQKLIDDQEAASDKSNLILD